MKPISYILFTILFFVIIQSSKAIDNNQQFVNTPINGFIENKGQIINQNNEPNPACLFLYNGKGLNVQLREDGFSYEVISHVNTSIINEETNSSFEEKENQFYIHRIDIFFNGMNTNTQIEKENESRDYYNYYTTSTPEQGILNVHYYNKIIYKNIYNNIDVEFTLNAEGKFEYNWIVKPGGNIDDINLRIAGANSSKLENGKIILQTSLGEIKEKIPASYYQNNLEELVDVNYQLTSSSNYKCIGYKISDYDKSRTLIIDPTPNIEWGTYYGGSGSEYGYGVTTDSQDNSFITGKTSSTTNIASSGAYQSTLSGSEDAFVVKFNDSGSRVWGTYYGGSDIEGAYSIISDSNDNIYFTGVTSSSSKIASSAAYQTTYGGSNDAFLVKLDNDGKRLWATYIGGNDIDDGDYIATDSQDNVIVSGKAISKSGIASSGSYQSSNSGSTDAFIAKFDGNGSLQLFTYYL